MQRSQHQGENVHTAALNDPTGRLHTVRDGCKVAAGDGCCKVRVEEGKHGGEGPKGKGQPAEGFKCARKQLSTDSQHQEGGSITLREN